MEVNTAGGRDPETIGGESVCSRPTWRKWEPGAVTRTNGGRMTKWTIIAQVVENGETIPVADHVDAPTPATAIEKFVARYPRPVDFRHEVRSICVNATPEDANKGNQPVARWLRKNWFKATPDARGRWRTRVIDELAGGYIVRAKKASEA